MTTPAATVRSAAPPQPRIIVFGDVVNSVTAVPARAIRPFTDTPSSIERSRGGAAADTAVWLGVLGAAVDFVGIAGAADADRHCARLSEAGVTPHIAVHDSLLTGTIVVIVEGDDRTCLTERGANAELDPDSVTDELLAGAAALHLTGHSLFGAADIRPVVRLIERARAAGVLVSVDPVSAEHLERYGPSRFLSDIAGADVVVPNWEEGALLTGLASPRDIAASLAATFGVAAVTLDEDGAVVAASSGVLGSVAADDVAVVNPSGAGDAFAAGFLLEWVRSRDALLAGRAGAAAGGRAVGAHAATPVA
jgi:sugar/nucleoside kinase (ribokinase family)